jgi:hypothetical protein
MINNPKVQNLYILYNGKAINISQADAKKGLEHIKKLLKNIETQ